MTEVVLVPEWKLPLIECGGCGVKYFLVAYFPPTVEHGTITEPGATLPQCKSHFCPYCGKPNQSVPLDSQALVGQDWPSSRAQQE